MRALTPLLLAVALAACSHKQASPDAPAAADAPSPEAAAQPPAPSPASDAAQLRAAATLREEGMRLLYSKDPRVKNPQLAFERLLQAAEMGDPLAMDSVGGFYSAGFGGAERSCAKAMEWFERSAAAGYGLAANNLAYLYVTCENKELRSADKAETIMRMMFSSNPSLIAVLDTYAALLAERGEFPVAAATMQAVISLEELINANPERIDESKKALGLYKKRRKLTSGFDPKPELPDSHR